MDGLMVGCMDGCRSGITHSFSGYTALPKTAFHCNHYRVSTPLLSHQIYFFFIIISQLLFLMSQARTINKIGAISSSNTKYPLVIAPLPMGFFVMCPPLFVMHPCLQETAFSERNLFIFMSFFYCFVLPQTPQRHKTLIQGPRHAAVWREIRRRSLA